MPLEDGGEHEDRGDEDGVEREDRHGEERDEGEDRDEAEDDEELEVDIDANGILFFLFFFLECERIGSGLIRLERFNKIRIGIED
jgi:hypothetical protein